MEAYIDKLGTHSLKCGFKTKDIESVIWQVASRKKLGGTRDVVKYICAYCNTNKNKFVTKIIEDVAKIINFLKFWKS